MKAALAIVLLTLVPALSAEEVLSERTVIIAPRRIEISPITDRAATANQIDDGAARVVARLVFRRGSMQLTAETRKILKSLRPTESALLIEGYSDEAHPNERLANLRARAVASFLEEHSDIRNIKIRWRATAFSEPEIGVTIKETP